MLDILIQYVLPSLLGVVGYKYLGAKRWESVKKTARTVLADEQNPITSPKEALERAIVLEHYREIDRGVAELEKQQARGELSIRASVERARATFAGVDRTIVPRDGTEEFK